MDTAKSGQRVEWLRALRRLDVAWRRSHTQRANGGRYALAGFKCQFDFLLRDLIASWLSGAPVPTVFAEVISDFTEASEEGLFVTQVKRRQTSSAVTEALTELWEIDCVAEAEGSMPGPLRYRILSARCELKDVSATLARWTPDAPVDPDRLTGFKDRVEPAVEYDVGSELLALVANRLQAPDPLGLIRRWQGELLNAGDSGDFTGASERIWSDLKSIGHQRARRDGSGTHHVWSAEDRPPERVERGEFLTGQTPTLGQLRKGYFAPRDQIFRPLLDAASRWIEARGADTDPARRIQVFWLAGCSGSGKSILLLQLLASLHESGHRPILWLGENVRALPEVMRRLREYSDGDAPVLVGLDDPYAPTASGDTQALWASALGELFATRQREHEALPIILACGPTDQVASFKGDLQDIVDIHVFELPPETSDRVALIDWFRARTGMDPPTIGGGNVLPVQLFFEWRTGEPIGAFATRFRRRIEAETEDPKVLIDWFSRLLALNRLYVGCPAGSLEVDLTPRQRDRYEQLRRDAHLRESRDDGRPGVWLAHPHLANAIYETWYPAASSRNIRRDHLERAIAQAVELGDSPSEMMAPLWAVSRALDPADSSGIGHRLASDDVNTLLERTHVMLVGSNGGRLPTPFIPVWLEICASGDVRLSPDPRAEALAAVSRGDIRERGLRLTCHKLLQFEDALSDEQGRGAQVLIFKLLQTHLEWNDWEPVAAHLLFRSSDPRLGPLIAAWTRARNPSGLPPLRPPRILLSAMQRLRSDPLIDLVCKLLEVADGQRAWGDLAIALLKQSGPSRPVLDWAERHRLEVGAGFLISNLIRAGIEQAFPLGRAWAELWHTERSATSSSRSCLMVGMKKPVHGRRSGSRPATRQRASS